MNRLNFGDIEVSKKEFYDSKVGIKLLMMLMPIKLLQVIKLK